MNWDNKFKLCIVLCIFMILFSGIASAASNIAPFPFVSKTTKYVGGGNNRINMTGGAVELDAQDQLNAGLGHTFYLKDKASLVGSAWSGDYITYLWGSLEWVDNANVVYPIEMAPAGNTNTSAFGNDSDHIYASTMYSKTSGGQPADRWCCANAVYTNGKNTIKYDLNVTSVPKPTQRSDVRLAQILTMQYTDTRVILDNGNEWVKTGAGAAVITKNITFIFPDNMSFIARTPILYDANNPNNFTTGYYVLTKGTSGQFTGLMVSDVYANWSSFTNPIFDPTIDATTSTTDLDHKNKPALVFINNSYGYMFYKDSGTTKIGYSKTTDGGNTWGSFTATTTKTDIVAFTVWYDQWTPGDTGNVIHIAMIGSGSKDVWYDTLNTNGDSQGTEVSMAQPIADFVTSNHVTITKGTTGGLFIAWRATTEDTSMGAKYCTTTCSSAGNWSTLTSPFTGKTNDYLKSVPISGGKIMLIEQLLSGTLQTRVLTPPNTWAPSGVTVDSNVIVNSAYPSTVYATVNRSNNNIYMAWVNNVAGAGNAEIKTAVYTGSSWTVKTNVITNANTITQADIFHDEANGDIYVGYLRGTLTTNMNAYFKKSSDGMTTWGNESSVFNTQTGDIRNIYLNMMGNSRGYGVIFQNTGSNDGLYGDYFPRPINITSWGNNATNNNSPTISVNQGAVVSFNLTTEVAVTSSTISTSSNVTFLSNSSLGSNNFWANLSFPGYGTKYVNLTVSNASTSSSTISWTITVNDITPPQVTSNTNNLYIRNKSVLTLNATITDLASGVKNASVNVSSVNSTINEAILTNVGGFWINNTIIADRGETNEFRNLSISAYDYAGNVNNSINMTVWIFYPSLYDSRDPNPPSSEGYWVKKGNVNVSGSGWYSNQTIRTRIIKPDANVAYESDIIADANGNFVEKVIVLNSDKLGTYTIFTSEDAGATWAQVDTFIVSGVTWYRPSYLNETLGAVGETIIVTASSDENSVKWVNFTWIFPNGSIAHTSGLVPAENKVQMSDNFDARVAGAWKVQVQFYKKDQTELSDQFSEMMFIVANKLILSAAPLVVSQGTNSTVTAKVTNFTGFPLNNNVVTFTTDLGTLNNGTTSGTTVTKITNSSGFASVNFSSSISGTVTITAVEQLKNSATIKIAAAVNYTVLTPFPEAILADGVSTSTIVANITNGIGPVPNNRVTLTTTLGTLSNGTVSNVTSLIAITDSNGLATVTLTSSVTEGTATITAVEQSGGRDAISVSIITISTQSDGNFNLSQTDFPRNQTVFAKTIGLDAHRKYSYSWYYPNGTLARQSPLMTGSATQTDIFVLSSDAQVSNSWKIDITRDPDTPIDNTTFTVVTQADQTYTPQNPILGEQMNSDAMTYSNPTGVVRANFTWIAPNGTTARSVIMDTTLMQAIDTFSPNINGTWTLNVVFLNNNDWEIDSNSTSFYVTFVPIDLLITQSNISFSYSSSLVETGDVRENNNVTINAMVYNGGYSASSVLVSFYDGSPGMGTIIANFTIPDIFARSSQNATIYWNSLPGTHNISIRVDPGNTISESNEVNNEASKLINVSAWQKYYGNISSGELGLKDQDNNSFNSWSLSVVEGNIFISRNSTYNFANLQALGRNKAGGIATGNFTRADQLLNMTQGTRNATGFSNNNITQLFSLDGTNPRNTTTFTVYGKTINNVGIVNSTNVTNFMSVGNATFITGILWDTTKDNGDGEYGDDSEELIFIGNVNVSKVGFISAPHDYEIAIPSTLGNGGVVYFNVEVKN